MSKWYTMIYWLLSNPSIEKNEDENHFEWIHRINTFIQVYPAVREKIPCWRDVLFTIKSLKLFCYATVCCGRHPVWRSSLDVLRLAGSIKSVRFGFKDSSMWWKRPRIESKRTIFLTWNVSLTNSGLIDGCDYYLWKFYGKYIIHSFI